MENCFINFIFRLSFAKFLYQIKILKQTNKQGKKNCCIDVQKQHALKEGHGMNTAKKKSHFFLLPDSRHFQMMRDFGKVMYEGKVLLTFLFKFCFNLGYVFN